MSKAKRTREKLTANRLKIAREQGVINTYDSTVIPPDAVLADLTSLSNNHTCGQLPVFYLDKIVTCRKCGIEELWPAEQQKWWYETAKGNINSIAIYCRRCRSIEKERKSQARQTHLNGLKKKNEKG